MATSAAWLRRARELLADEPELARSPARAAVHNSLGSVLMELGDLAGARAELEQAQAVLSADPDTYQLFHPWVAAMQYNLGHVLLGLGVQKASLSCFEQALSVARQTGQRRLQGNAAYEVGVLYAAQGRWADALKLLEECLALRQLDSAVPARAQVLFRLGQANLALGRHDKAEALFREAIPLYEQIRDRLGQAWSQTGLGISLLQRGRAADASSLLEAARGVFVEEMERWPLTSACRARLISPLPRWSRWPAKCRRMDTTRDRSIS